MRLRTKKFLKEKFREYYSRTELKIPPSLEEREWGVILLNKNYPDETVMRRHKSFSSRGEMSSYIQSMVPAHVYFSSAYYERPSAPTMKEKGWKGADLVFDLDADHLRGTEDLDYMEMLERVKKETKQLINDFLLEDFGFKEENIELVFSGGRGYHIHIRDEKILDLNSQERREIVDYLFGRGTKSFVREKKEKGAKITYMSPEETNWNNKIRNHLFNDFLSIISKSKKQEAMEKLTNYKNVGKKTAERIYEFLNKEDGLEKIKETGKLDIAKGVPRSFWTQVIEEIKQDIQARADEPVTSDIKRLIRLPKSLHGGTGFEVKPMALEELNDFSPFKDSIVFRDDPVRIYCKQNHETKLKNKEIRIKKDEVKKVPEYVAVFLSCIGVAEVEGW